MQELQELIEIVNKYKLRNVEVIGNVARTDSKYQEFYDLIHSETVNTDEEAAAHYNLKPTDKSYRRLKNELKHRMGNMLFLIDLEHPGFTEYQKKRYNGIRDWAVFLLSDARGANAFALELVKKSLKEIEKIEYTSILIEYYGFLAEDYGIRQGNEKEFEKYIKLLEQQRINESAEVEGYISVIRLMQPYVKKKVFRKGMSEMAAKEKEKLEKYRGKVSTTKFLLYYYLVDLMEKMHGHDYDGGIDVCKKALLEIKSKSYFYINSVSSFYHNLISMLTYKKRYTEAEDYFLESNEYIEKGRNNWFKHQELYITLLLHQEKFAEAWEIFSSTIKNKNFKKLAPNLTEIWRINEAWLHLAAAAGEFELIEKKLFKLSKFLNEVPLFSQDKSGMNVQIILIQVAFLIQRGRYEDVGEKIDALKKYRSRHLKLEGVNMRSNAMIKIVTRLAKESFHKSNTIKKTEETLTLMMTQSSNILDDVHDLEIVPYEFCWRWILAGCDNDFH